MLDSTTADIDDTKIIRNRLAEAVKAWKQLKASPGAWLREEFVLRCGVSGHKIALPGKYPRGMIKMCFYNSICLVRRFNRSLRYCEGFVIDPELPIPILHAWALDKDDNIIDVTLSEARAAALQYLGVAVTTKEYRQWTGPQSASLLDCGIGLNVPFIIDRCPDLLTEEQKRSYEDIGRRLRLRRG
jgi:hypothetical protein